MLNKFIEIKISRSVGWADLTATASPLQGSPKNWGGYVLDIIELASDYVLGLVYDIGIRQVYEGVVNRLPAEYVNTKQFRTF